MADNPFQKTDTLDDILLDVATLIELSPRDRRIAENRYRLLKEHLEREKSPLARYLVDGASLIYAQGSVVSRQTASMQWSPSKKRSWRFIKKWRQRASWMQNLKRSERVHENETVGAALAAIIAAKAAPTKCYIPTVTVGITRF